MKTIVRGRPENPSPDEFPDGLVRAYVELATALDEGRPALLDGEMEPWADQARALVEAQTGQARPVKAATPPAQRTGSMVATLAPPVWLDAAIGGKIRIGAAVAASETMPDTRPSTAVAAGPVPDSTVFSGRKPIPIAGQGQVRELIHPGDWIAMSLDPTIGGNRQLVLMDRTDGSYVVRVESGDAAQARLDGGLIVPGRCYRIHGSATITARGGRIGIQVLPLAAAGVVWDGPVLPPAGAG